jgi:tetratricopeptide (TPR) repeat protein
MIYLLVIAVAGIVVASIMLTRERIRRHNVRRIVRRMGKRVQVQPDTHEENGFTSARSARAAAMELHRARTLLRSAEREMYKGDYDKAEHHLVQAITSAPQEVDAQVQLGLLYIKTGRGQKAQAVLEPLAEQSGSATVFAHLAQAYKLQAREKDACGCFRKALDLDPRSASRQADLGTALAAMQADDEATPLLELALKQLPRRMDLLRILAQCYERMNNENGLKDAYQRINRLDPRDAEVREKLQELQ